MDMRLAGFVFAGVLAAAPAMAQDAASTSAPVSLDHIRAGLERPASTLVLKPVEVPADFRLHVLEQQKIDALIATLDFRSGPVPPGGLYGYEQQRITNPTDSPLSQPYAAFSGAELITVAIENFIARYLGGHLAQSLGDAERARAERLAREEVARSIAGYCAARQDRDDIVICNAPSR
ncbi:MAG: hypothetical protein ABI665_22360 [Vicinamibacterales bacterium]